MIGWAILLLAAPASVPPTGSTLPTSATPPVGPLPKSCGTSGTKPKPSDNQYPESYGAACSLQREVKEMTKTLSDEPIDGAYGSADQWGQIDGNPPPPAKDKDKTKAKTGPKPQTP